MIYDSVLYMKLVILLINKPRYFSFLTYLDNKHFFSSFSSNQIIELAYKEKSFLIEKMDYNVFSLPIID